MATVIRREIRKRGFFGWVFLLIFIAFNIFMAISMIAGASGVSSLEAHTEAEKAGHAIGSVLGFGFLLFVWTCGAVIFGLLAYFSRGKKTIIEETLEGPS